MKQTILDRYLLRECAGAWAAVTFVLLAVMLATRFSTFLADAAAGKLPREFLLKVVALSSLQYLVVLIPISLLFAVMLSLGRLYKDQEVAAMMGCGVGLRQLYRPFLRLAVLLALLTAGLSFEIGPWAGRQADYLVKDAGRLLQYTPFEAGRFKEAAGGRAVFYAGGIDERQGELQTIFAQIDEPGGTSVLTAKRGRQSVDPRNGDRIVRLEEGYRYQGEPGEAGYDIIAFEGLSMRVAPPQFLYIPGKRKLMETGQLAASSDPKDRAELEWRVAAPISVFLLALLAVPLAHTSPRQGRYGKLVLGIAAYLVYSNLLGIGQAWIAKDRALAPLGLWWVHLLIGVWAAILVARRLGWRPAILLRRAPA